MIEITLRAVLEIQDCIAVGRFAKPKIGYESGYKTHDRFDISSCGAGLPAQLRFNV